MRISRTCAMKWIDRHAAEGEVVCMTGHLDTVSNSLPLWQDAAARLPALGD